MDEKWGRFRSKKRGQKIETASWSMARAFAMALLHNDFKRRAREAGFEARCLGSGSKYECKALQILNSALCYKFETKSKGPKNGVTNKDPKMGPKSGPKNGVAMKRFINSGPISGPTLRPHFELRPHFWAQIWNKSFTKKKQKKYNLKQKAVKKSTRDYESALYPFFFKKL